jgi:hypothetical protein
MSTSEVFWYGIGILSVIFSILGLISDIRSHKANKALLNKLQLAKKPEST